MSRIYRVITSTMDDLPTITEEDLVIPSDYPVGGITSLQMEKALLDNQEGLYKHNYTFLCLTNGTYQKDHIYRFNIDGDQLSWVDIGQLGGGVELVDAAIWEIDNTLVNCSLSNTDTTIDDGDAYTATLTAETGYSLSNAYVKVYMNNVDITSTAYSDGTISIDDVTGDLRIVALIVNSTFENNTWPIVFKTIQAGYVPLTWYGTTKALALTNNTTMNMRMVDTKAGRYSFVDGTVSHAVLLSDELFNAGNVSMESYSYYSNAGGIRAMSSYRNYVNNTMMPLLPTEFKNLLKEVYQVSNNGYNCEPNEQSILVSKTILPSYGELFAPTTLTVWYINERVNNGVDYGIYEYFEEHTSASYKVKTRIGQTYGFEWWLRSPSHNDRESWFSVNSSGSTSVSPVFNGYGVALCIPV